MVASEKSRMPLEPKDEPEENELTHAALAQGLNEFFAGVFPEEQQRASSFADLATGKKQTDKKGKKITKQTSVRLKTLMINPSSQLRRKLHRRREFTSMKRKCTYNNSKHHHYRCHQAQQRQQQKRQNQRPRIHPLSRMCYMGSHGGWTNVSGGSSTCLRYLG